MEIRHKVIASAGIRFSITVKNKEVGHAYLYIMRNDLDDRPFGFLEDVFVDESVRGYGIATKLIKQVIKTAEENNCYKIVATSRYSRPKVHTLYKRLGFQDHGKEFRIDL